MARGERPISRAKTTTELKRGMQIKVYENGIAKDAVITSIFDRWTIGTTIGSCWADCIRVVK